MSAKPTEGGIPPRRTGEVPREARRRGINPRGGNSLNPHYTTAARHACGNYRFPTRAGAVQSLPTM